MISIISSVNDTHGHDAGDLVLTAVATVLRKHIRGSDIACRYGGEEFVLVLPDASLEGTRRRAEGIRSAIKRLELFYQGKAIGKITASIGISMFPEHATDPETLMLRSDRLMYHAKKSGRDRVVTSLEPKGPPSNPEGASA